MCILTALDSAGRSLYAVCSAFAGRETDIMCPAVLKLFRPRSSNNLPGPVYRPATTGHSANQRSEGCSVSDPVFIRGQPLVRWPK
jgi:hypothetical protein